MTRTISLLTSTWFVVASLLVLDSHARANDLEPAPGYWYDSVGATPFDLNNALDIVDFCEDASALENDACVHAWVNAARSQGKHLFASAGDYTLDSSLPVFDGMHLRCSAPSAVVFRKREGAWRPHFAFVEGPVRDVSIESCGFDMRGDPSNFAFAFGMSGGERITFRGNRVFDSITSRCIARSCQRQYVVILRASDVLIEDNHFSEGGRIKAGRPGRRIVIRNNFLEFVNDNGISVVGRSGAGWLDGTNTSEDILIDGNTILDAIGAGIFFGADGEPSGSGVTTRGVTVINNVVAGDTQLCILGTLPDYASDVFIGNNRCLQSSEAKFNVGIGVKRTRDVAGEALRVSIWGNYVKSASPGTLDSGAYFVSGAQTCLVDNLARGAARPTFFQPEAELFTFRNDWEESAPSRGWARDLRRCFVPDFLGSGVRWR